MLQNIGWQTVRGQKNGIFVDKIGEFSWTLLVNSRVHFVHEKSSFGVNFHEHFFGEFSWTFLVNFRGHFSTKDSKSTS